MGRAADHHKMTIPYTTVPQDGTAVTDQQVELVWVTIASRHGMAL